MAEIQSYFEKKGIPTVSESATSPIIQQSRTEKALLTGVPATRQVAIPINEWVEKCPEQYLPKFLEALTMPLTDEEKRSGKYKPPAAPRIAMKGTYDEVQAFFEGDLSAFMDSPPLTRWTDGLPVTPPTPEAVTRMLKGTSHKPDEIVNPAMGPQKRPVTVEKVAINAVMAGCKPEYFPVCLALVEGGLSSTWQSSGSQGLIEMISGPIVKEIGMNTGLAFLAPNNTANATLQRFCMLAIKNLEGIKPGSGQVQAYGTMLMGLIMPESPETPWEGLNVRYGFSKKDSVIIELSGLTSYNGHEICESTLMWRDNPEVPKQLVTTMQVCQSSITGHSRYIVINPEQARRWQTAFGWDTMAKLQDFLWDNVLWPRKNFDLSYWWGKRAPFDKQEAYMKAPRGSRHLNPDHIEAPPDTLVPITDSPLDYTILVAGAGSPAYHLLQPAFAWGSYGSRKVLLIDKWR